jgi:hypothetical protein
MVQERVSGNGNFDIDAIRMPANAMENAPAVIDQPFVDPVADAFAADVQDTADEIRYNPGSNLAEEAMQIMNAPGAAKLGAGVLADLRAAVQLQEEKAANGADAFMRGDRVWEERKERDDKDRKEQAKIADMADDANNAQLSTTPDRFGNSQQDYADLSNELKTRDGQERYMSFLRLLHPNMTDAQIRERMEKTAAIAAREANQPLTERQQGLLENMPPAEEAELKGEVDQYNEMNGRDMTQEVTAQVDAQTTTASAETAQITTYTAARSDLLRGGLPNLTSTDQATLLPSRTSVASQMDSGEADSSSPSLRRSFVDANAATAPLDVRQPQLASAAPAMPATPTNAGLDV